MALTKKGALAKIFKCAALWKKNFSGFNFLFAYQENNMIVTLEAAFSASNFRHLTGVSTPMGAGEFFDKALKHRLRDSDFELSQKGMTDMKLSVLPEFLEKLSSSAKIFGEYDRNSKIRLNTENLVGCVKSCMGFVRDDSGIFVPNTVLAENIKQLVINANHIVAVWRKKRAVRLYDEEIFVNHQRITDKNLTQQYVVLKSDKFSA